jgi:Xaa-Pro aminopeptidase
MIQTPEMVDDATTLFPSLTVATRDRRFFRAREFMRDAKLDGLVLFGLRGREHFDHYFTNEAFDGAAVLPLDGAAAQLAPTPLRTLARFDAVGATRERWVADVRTGSIPANLAAVLRERGLDRARIGVVGLDSHYPSEPQGVVPYPMWSAIQQALPGVKFEEISAAFALDMLPKGEEELRMLRRGAAIGEAACEAFLAACREGALESEVYAAVVHAIHVRGATTVPPHMLLRSGTETLGWGPPEWLFGGGVPRTLARGDLIGAEIFSVLGGLETQQQMVVSIGEPSAEQKLLADVARASYEIGVGMLRPGVRFASVCEAMQRPLIDANCWNLGPLIQTTSPLILNGGMRLGADQQPGLRGVPVPPPQPPDGDVTIQPGTVFAVEPNALRDKRRVCVGGTVLVTEDGCEELNRLPCHLNVVAV